jgi:tol-pal system protein YbgF
MLTALAEPAAAGAKEDVEDLQARMERVEQSINAQSAAIVRINELESQIQQLTGQIEELSYKLDQANFRLDAVSAALAGDADALSQLPPSSSPGGAYGGPSGPLDLGAGAPAQESFENAGRGAGRADPAAAVSVELPLDPGAAYDYASGFLLAGDYPRAKAAFELYLEAFPNHPRTSDARFRLGEIYLAIGDNADAADSFIAHIRDYPNDPRAAEAYLKLGTAFSRLQRPDEACTVFKTMQSKYPNAPDAVRQRADLEMARIDCR